MDDPIYIIGHRNPDADAICSAIGYAELKKHQGVKHAVAARCGNSNARIDAILKRFNAPLPQFIGDVTPRVRDIMVPDVIKVAPDSICTEALELFDKHDVRVLPVADKDNKLHGTLSIFSVGEFFIPTHAKEKSMRVVRTTLADIVRALDAEVIHLEDEDKLEELYVRVGAMDIRSFGRWSQMQTELASNSVIIVGDRYDIQQKSIQAGVRLLVISGGLPVEDDVIELARQRKVSMIRSPNDSATTSWLIRSARRIEELIDREPAIFSPEEKLVSVRRRIGIKDRQAFMVVNEDEELVGVFTKTDLLKPVRTQLILMDHNELSQAVPGAEHVKILEVVDHHRLGNPPTDQPIFFFNAPLGSTSTIVADLFRKAEIEPSESTAGVLMGGIISDTLNLRGPTTTDTDAEILEWLSKLAGVSSDDLASEIFSSGSVILSHEPLDAIRADMKIYDEGKVRFSVSQVEELGFGNFWERRSELEDALEQVCSAESLDFAALLITDINRQNSLLLMVGSDDLVDLVTYPRNEAEDVFELNGIVSRKKQLIPYFSSMLRGQHASAAES